METAGVKDMIKWSTTEKLFGDAPTIHQLEFIDGFDFSRDSVNQAPDPHVLFADLGYQSGTVPQSLPYWKEVVETGRNDEPGTLMYGVLKDPASPDKLYVLEAYESAQYLADVHVPSKAIQDSVKNTKHLRTGLKHTPLKLHAGFLHRE
jgi:quinol monooxygenase YgiN